MKIYWTLKSIPELKNLPLRERGRRWRRAYRSVFLHWESWGGMVLCGVCAGAGSHFFGMTGGILMAGMGGFLYGQIATYVVMKYYRHRLH